MARPSAATLMGRPLAKKADLNNRSAAVGFMPQAVGFMPHANILWDN
jgi:hypothetical protein